jgi:flagellar biosynthesis protein FliQ
VIAMTDELLLVLAREALLLMVMASLPPLAASLLVGFVAGVFQAATQIQESSLSVVPKLGAAALSLVLAGPWIAAQLTRFTAELLRILPEVGS